LAHIGSVVDYDSLAQKIMELLVSSRLLQFSDGTLIVNPRFLKKILDGVAFSASNRFEGVANDASIDLLFENPSDSGKKVFLITAEVISFGRGYIDVYRDSGVTVSGTAVEPVNLNFESANESVCNVEYGGTYDLGASVHRTVIPGGSKVRAIGFAVEVGESVIIPENHNLLLRFTNKSGAATDMSIRLIWWEE